MKARHLDGHAAPPVLRGVVLHAQPHALVRPGRMPVAGLPASKGHVQGLPQASAAALDAALTKGREEGYAAGHAAGVEQERAGVAMTIDAARIQAQEEGHQAGMRHGLEAAAEEIEIRQATWRREFDEAQRTRALQLESVLRAASAEALQRLSEAEDDLVAISHEAVCRILGNEAHRADTIRSMVRHLLAEHGARAQLAVHVHPDDAQVLSEFTQSDHAPWQFVADKAVNLGGVILRSPQGSLDARLETQLVALRDSLTAVRAQRKAMPSRNGTP